MGGGPEILIGGAAAWWMKATKVPVWAKMTPNITHIEDPSRAALCAFGCPVISAFITFRSVIGVDLETLRPEPSVEGYTTPGGYSCKAVLPIALRMCMEIATLIQHQYPGPLAVGHRQRRVGQGCRPSSFARLRHGAGLHLRDESRLPLREGDVRRAGRVHGEA